MSTSWKMFPQIRTLLQRPSVSMPSSPTLYTRFSYTSVSFVSAAVLEGLVIEEMSREPLEIEYAELADAADTSRLTSLDRPGFLAVAARSGRTRLIDNVWLYPDGTSDRGVRLEGDSVLYGGGD